MKYVRNSSQGAARSPSSSTTYFSSIWSSSCLTRSWSGTITPAPGGRRSAQGRAGPRNSESRTGRCSPWSSLRTDSVHPPPSAAGMWQPRPALRPDAASAVTGATGADSRVAGRVAAPRSGRRRTGRPARCPRRATSPDRISRASRSPIAVCTRRRSGRAPYAGSLPSSRQPGQRPVGDLQGRAGGPRAGRRSRSICSPAIRAQLVLGQRGEDHDVVQPVEELRLEGRPHRLQHPLPLLLLGQRRVDQELAAQVGGEDQDGVAEVDRPALAVGQPAVVQHLEQDVEDLRVRLLHLVQQHHACTGAAAPPR